MIAEWEKGDVVVIRGDRSRRRARVMATSKSASGERVFALNWLKRDADVVLNRRLRDSFDMYCGEDQLQSEVL